jgi:hypothetical protein
VERNLIKKVCYREDVDCIIYQKLRNQMCDNFLAWHYERSGVFSVRSAYKLAYNICYGTRWQASGSTSSDNTLMEANLVFSGSQQSKGLWLENSVW